MTGVTVGIPAWNEGRFLDRTLAQLVKNYDYIDRIIISDNASTDNTFEIASGYAAKYPKIEVQRLEKNVPMYDNWMRLLNQAGTEYFMWMGGHDIVSDNYFSDIVPKLDARPEAVAAFSMIYMFNETLGWNVLWLDSRISTIDSDDVLKRVYAVLHQEKHCIVTNQLCRTKYLKKVMSTMPPYKVNGDCVIAMHLALLGPSVTSYKSVFYERLEHKGDVTHRDSVRRYNMQHHIHVPLVNPKHYIPQDYWSLCQELAPAICNDTLREDIVASCEKLVSDRGGMDADIDDEVWLKRHNWSQLCEKLRYLNKPVALLGAGIDGYEARRFAEYGGKLHFAAYVRSSDEEIHEAFANNKIESMDFLQGKAEEWVVIVADEFHEDELIEHLNEMGYEEYSSCFSMWDMLYFIRMNDTKKEAVKKETIKLTKKERILRALHKYNAVQLTGKVIAKSGKKIGGKIAKLGNKITSVSKKLGSKMVGEGAPRTGKHYVIYEPKENSTNKHTLIINDILTELGYKVIDALQSIGYEYCNQIIDVANFNFFDNIYTDENDIQQMQKEYDYKVNVIRRLKAKHTKIITTVHNRNNHGGSGTRAELQRKIWLLLLKESDVLIIRCNATLEYFKKDYDKHFASKLIAKSVLIPPASYKGYYPLSGVSGQCKDKTLWPENKDAFKVLFFGGISPYKNVELLLDMMERAQDIDAHLMIWGGGEENYIKPLSEKAKPMSNVTFRGEFIDDGAIWSVIQSCDCVILPYNTDSMINSGAVMLAASVGRNIIVPDIGTVQDMPNGLIYSYHYDNKNEHPDALFGAFKTAYNDFKNDRSAFNKRAEELCRLMDGKYSVENIKPKYKALYETLCK